MIKAHIPVGLSRHVSTRHDTFDVSSASRLARQAVLFEKLHSQNAWARKTCRVVSRRDVTRQVEFWLK